MEALISILLFFLSIVICITYTICASMVISGIVIVALTIIIGVCKVVLAIIDTIKNRKNEKRKD